MEIWKQNKYSIYITDSVINVLKKYKQNSPKKNESGGILLGQIKGNNIFILKASIPTKFDKSTRFSFERNSDLAQIIINYEFLNSGNKTIYLGEWHTHAENSPTPSVIDEKMIKDQFKENTINEPYLVFIIQGLKNIYVSMYDGESIIKLTKSFQK